MNESTHKDAVAVLTAGGLDSSVLLAELAQNCVVYPIYVCAGLAWERDEQIALACYIDAINNSNIKSLTTLSVAASALHGDHWSVTGQGVPDITAPDESSFIPGRNIVLLSLAAVWCSTHGVHEIAIGSLDANPFPDASPEFFMLFGKALGMGLAHEIKVIAPYRGLHKSELIRRHYKLPLELTLTCAAPQNGMHCGACSKCRERHDAFIEAGIDDKTQYLYGY